MNIDEILKRGKVVTEAPKQETGFVAGVKSDIQARGASYDASKDMPAPVRGVVLAGQTAGAAFDIGMRGIEALYKKLPDALTNPLEAGAKEAATLALEVPEVQEGLKRFQKGVEDYQLWKTDNPKKALLAESTLNLLMTTPVGAGAKATLKGGEAAAGMLGEVASKAAIPLEKRLQTKLLDDAIDIVSPKLNTKKTTQALASGRGETGALGKYGKTTLKASAEDLRVATAVKGIVSPTKSPVANIAAIRSRIAELSTGVRAYLKDHNGIFNENELRAALSLAKEDSRIIFGTDKTLESAYDAVADELVRIAEKSKFDLASLYESRIKFDTVVEQKFPRVFDGTAGDNVRANAVLDVRRAVNEFVASKLPEGNPFKTTLKQEARMFTGVENIAKKTAGIVNYGAAQRIVKFMRANPVTSFATGGILTFGAMSGLLTNPLVLGSLALYGTYKTAKGIITSQTLTRALLGLMETLSKMKTKNATKALELKEVKDAIVAILLILGQDAVDSDSDTQDTQQKE